VTIFEDLFEVYYRASTYRDSVVGRCEVDTVTEALGEVNDTTGPETSVVDGDVIVVLDCRSAKEISNRLGDDVHVTHESPHIDSEHAYSIPRRIEQALPGKTQVHTVESSSRFGVALVPSAVTYDNTIADPAGVIGIYWVVQDDD